MKRGADDAVWKLARMRTHGLLRPVSFEGRGTLSIAPPCLDPAPRVGSVRYVLKPAEHIPVDFLGAIQFREWIFTVERTAVSPDYFVCAFWKEQDHVNFGRLPIEDGQAGAALINWFMTNVASVYAEAPPADDGSDLQVRVSVQWDANE